MIAGAVGVFVPYTILTIIFDYPDILRQDAGVILTRFHEGGSGLIATWFSFAILGLPLVAAYIMLGQKLESSSAWMRTATSIGVIGLLVQMVGLLRWTFVVPVLADSYVHATDTATKIAAVTSFKTVHQYGGVLLGEHMGQLFTIIWTVIVTVTFAKQKWMPKWVTVLGYVSSFIYFLAQADLFATVIPGFPVWDMAGFIGSTLWLVWLIVVGVRICLTPS